jgi:hypothetical protein
MPFLALPLLLALATAPLVSPRVTSMAPPGGQRGTEVKVVFRGERLLEPQGILCSRTGIELVSVAAVGERNDHCEVVLRLAPDCALGAHVLRLRTAHGLSNAVLFHVGVLPVHEEQRQGDAAMALPLDATVHGSVASESTDTYTVDVPQGSVVACELESFRLGRGATDLALEVAGPDGTTLARCDDSSLGLKDPVLVFTASASGTHRIVVKPAWPTATAGSYRLHVGRFARPLGAVPCGGTPGQELEVELLGCAPGTRARVRLPDALGPYAWFPETAAGTPPSPVWLHVGGPANGEPRTDEKGRMVVQWPCSVHGVLRKPGEGARYHFTAKKGESVEFRAVCRSIRSAMDPLLLLRNAGGGVLAANDDDNGMDSVLRASIPADGEYSLEIRDLLRGGSEAHYFRVEGGPRPAAPRTSVAVGRLEEAMVSVPQGQAVATVLTHGGHDLDSGLEFFATELPPGVSAEFGPFVKGSNVVPVLLRAAPEAPLGGSQAGLRVRATKEPLERPGGYTQELALVRGRNDVPLFRTVLDRIPVAVTRPTPFTVELTAPPVPLVRGAPIRLQVRVARAEGNKAPLTVRTLWNPPGTTSGTITVPPEATSGELVVDASAGAATGTFRMAVVAAGPHLGGTLETASAFVDLTVEEPWLGGEIGKARTEQGQPVDLSFSLQPTDKAKGTLQAVLLGAPRGVKVEPLDLPAGATLGTFRLAVEPGAQLGKHRSMQVEVRVATAAGPVVHRIGGGELRIDAPLPSDASKTGTTGQAP